MKNWKKLAALGMTVLMTAGVFAGCGSSNSGDAGKDQSSGQSSSDQENTSDTQGDGTDNADTDSGEKKEVYVFIRDRGDLSYWDSMAEGSDRAVTDYADRANVHVAETTADIQANLQAMYEAADAGADLIITASDFKDNLVEVSNEYPDISLSLSVKMLLTSVKTTMFTVLTLQQLRLLT